MKIEEITKRIIYICKENNFNKIYIYVEMVVVEKLL